MAHIGIVNQMYQYDVVIVGAGVSGALMANELAIAGLKVLMLEAGTAYSNRAEYLNNYYTAPPSERDTPESPYPTYPQAPFPRTMAPNDYFVQSGPTHERFQGTYLRMAGGTTLHWLGTALRLHPNDFRIKSLYDIGKDWPITYADLEPWYCKAESALGVAGDANASTIPRSQPYPMPPIPMSYLGTIVKRHTAGTLFDGNPLTVAPTPQARNSIDGYQHRPACSGFHSCIPICPIQAKYDALVHLKLAQSHGAILQTESVVYRLNLNNQGEIESLDYKRWDGSTHNVTSKIVVLAAHGIETPKLLLNSHHPRLPNGLANSSDQVGRNLMDHALQLSYAVTQDALYPGRSSFSTAGIESIIDGPFRKSRGTFRLEISDSGFAWPKNSPYNVVAELASQGIIGAQLNEAINQQMAHQLTLTSLVEVLPSPNNRVMLANKHDALGIPRPEIKYKLDAYTYAGLARARDMNNVVFQKLNATQIQHFPDEKWQSGAHIMGTTTMGNDKRTSVVDSDLRSHDHRNLFIVGSSVFTTGGCSNPTLTIAALTLRASQTIIQSINFPLTQVFLN